MKFYIKTSEACWMGYEAEITELTQQCFTKDGVASHIIANV